MLGYRFGCRFGARVDSLATDTLFKSWTETSVIKIRYGYWEQCLARLTYAKGGAAYSEVAEVMVSEAVVDGLGLITPFPDSSGVNDLVGWIGRVSVEDVSVLDADDASASAFDDKFGTALGDVIAADLDEEVAVDVTTASSVTIDVTGVDGRGINDTDVDSNGVIVTSVNREDVDIADIDSKGGDVAASGGRDSLPGKTIIGLEVGV